MTENELKEKLEKIERLFAGATTEGERNAANNARERILSKLKQTEEIDPPVEYKFSLGDQWSRQLFIALARRYGLSPYRRKRQRYTTVMLKAPTSFIDQTLWPEFQDLDKVLTTYIKEVTNRVIKEIIHEDTSEAEIKAEQPRLL